MLYLAENEQELLDVCANEDVDGGSRGRLFELVVIQRCQKADFRISEESEPVSVVSNQTDKFSGKLLPSSFAGHSPDGLYTPYNPNFPAIDLIWKNPCELSRRHCGSI